MEEWKQIKGFDGLYEVSNMGKIRSNYHQKPKIIKAHENSRGYLRVRLRSKNKAPKMYFVHRLVAESFIEHSKSDNVVNHKDFNPKNNSVENLEWTTNNGNMKYSADAGRFNKNKRWKEKIKYGQRRKFKPIIGESLKDESVIVLEVLNDCKKYGFSPSCVCNCCKGNRETHKGYTWRYATPDEIERLKQTWH